MAHSDHRKPPLSPFPQNGQRSGQGEWMWSWLCLFSQRPIVALTCPSSPLAHCWDPQSHCGMCFSKCLVNTQFCFFWFLFCFNIKNTLALFIEPLFSTHSSEEPVWLNRDKISMFRSSKRLIWEVLQAIKMARFHHFLHTNYHKLGASALPLFIPEPMLHYLWHTHTHTYTQ